LILNDAVRIRKRLDKTEAACNRLEAELLEIPKSGGNRTELRKYLIIHKKNIALFRKLLRQIIIGQELSERTDRSGTLDD
jgi:hypothetical protein